MRLILKIIYGAFPAYKMKMALPHIVPLSRQAIELLKGLQPITGNKQFVFL